MIRRFDGLLALFLSIFFFCTPFISANENSVYIHGFISQGYMKSDKNNFLTYSEDGSFEFNEMGINFLTKASEKLNIGIQLFARDLGETDNDAIIVDWAYADYRFRDYLGFRAGRIKTPSGLYHETRDIDMQRTCILLPSGAYTDNFRDVIMAANGASIYGEFFNDLLGNLSYKLICGTNNIRPDGGTVFAAAGSNWNVTNTDIGSAAAGCLWWTDPSNQIKIGGTVGYISEMNFDATTAIITYYEQEIPDGLDSDLNFENILNWIVSVEITTSYLRFAAEYRRLLSEIDIFLLQVPLFKEKTEGEGYYALISHRFSDLFEAGYYYSVIYPNMHDRDGDESYATKFMAFRKDQAISFRFDLNDNWIFKMEAHYIDGCAAMFARINPDGFHRYWYLFVTKLSYSF